MISKMTFWVLCGVVGWAGLAPSVRAQINNTLVYGTNTNAPLRNERGELLPGSPSVTGAVAHIYLTSTNMGIIPPFTNGLPHPSNSLVHVAYVGQNTDPNPEDGIFAYLSGLFALDRTIPHTVFARVFNRETVEDSSFYRDSRIYVTPTDAYGIFLIEVDQTDIPLDPNDDDGDSLNNSWEKSLGTDRLNPDTDDDGVSDYDEFLAGTSGVDGDDYLQMVELYPAGFDDLVVQWSSVSGKVYQAEYATNQLDAAVLEYFPLYDPVTAVSTLSSLVFTNGGSLGTPHFRVRLLHEQ